MGVLVPIRTLVMVLVGRVVTTTWGPDLGSKNHHHDDNGGRCLGRVGSFTNTQVTIQKVDV